jgi:hypothetical protein
MAHIVNMLRDRTSIMNAVVEVYKTFRYYSKIDSWTYLLDISQNVFHMSRDWNTSGAKPTIRGHNLGSR